jgi:hypothetical protein
METEAGLPRWYPPARWCPGSRRHLSTRPQHLGVERRTWRAAGLRKFGQDLAPSYLESPLLISLLGRCYSGSGPKGGLPGFRFSAMSLTDSLVSKTIFS